MEAIPAVIRSSNSVDEHLAHVYESDDDLVEAAGSFLEAALARGAAVIVIATDEHLQGLRRRWQAKRFGLKAGLANGRIVLLEAGEVLSRLLRGDCPDPRQFDEHIGTLMRKTLATFGEVAAFGEMVQLLADRGRMDAAIALEDLWNRLRSEHAFSLLCGYRLATVGQAQHSQAFEAICSRHQRMMPSEPLERALREDPDRTIAQLQQKAHALDREREARQQGQARLAHLAAIIASSDDAIVSKSLEGIVRTWNAGAQRIFGYTAEEMVDRSITILIPEELRSEEDMILERIRAGQRVDHFETERVTKDGRRIPVALTVSPIVDEDGTIIGASKIARDISARRAVETDSERTREQLQAEARALAALNVWSSRLWSGRTLDEGLDSLLDALIDLLGADMGNIQLCEGDELRMVARRGLDDAFEAVFARVSASDNSACGRALRLRQRVIIQDVESDTAYAPYLPIARQAGYRTVLSEPLLTAAGHVLGIVTVQFRQVRELTEAELFRAELYARHASDFIQRCRAETALREADRAKDQFLAMLAHELRNPLAPIRSCVHLLQMCGADADKRGHAVAILDRQASHMTRLVDDLLDASRIGSGKIVLRLEDVDLTGVLRQAVDTSRPLVEAAGHTLVIDVPSDTVLLRADPVRLAQVVSNLLNNAAKYTPQGGRIVLCARRYADTVEISVEDNGTGIAPDMLTRVFGMFAQIEQTLQRSQGGLGIGLSLVKALVELHGGTVQAYSDGPRTGSRFVVRLPVAGPGTTD